MPLEDEEDVHVGRPSMFAKAGSAGDGAVMTSSNEDIGGRNSADEPGPLGVATSVTSVSSDVQNKRNEVKKKQEADRVLAELLAEAKLADGVVRRTIRHLSIATFVLLAGFGGFLLWTQLVQVIMILGTLPPWWSGLGLAGLVGCLVLVLASMGRLLWFAFQFQRNRPVTRRLLEEREHMRDLSSRDQVEARKQLSDYMKLYALDDVAQRHFLRRWGLSDSDWELMKQKRDELLHDNDRKDLRSWQECFGKCFLGPLDKAANKIIKDYAVLTGIKTAICPYALLDMAVVIYMGTSMLGSLCRVYQLRAGPLGMLYLFGLVMGQAFFANQAEEHSEELANWVEEPVSGVLEHLDIVGSELAGKAIGKLTTKAGQGLANGLFINRIGRQACKMLQPLTVG